jgi:hypothetical protein
MPINDEARHKAEEERQAIYPKALPTQKHGEAKADPMRWLVRNRLPETGAGYWKDSGGSTKLS